MNSSFGVGREALTGEFGQLVNDMAGWYGWSSGRERNNARSAAHKLFRWLRDRGHEGMSSVTLDDFRAYYMQRAQEGLCMKGFRARMLLLCRYMSESGKIAIDPTPVFNLKIPQRRKLMPAMPPEMITRILDAIDRSTSYGKRDYAFILLAAAMGLRMIDIANLRLKDIDWRKGVINTVQQKTSRAISLPLLRGVGDALKDYILNGRGGSGLEQVFLTLDGRRRLSRNAIFGAFVRRCGRAGVARTPKDGYSFHSLRRSVGTRLCTAGVPLTTIAQYLGHTDLESTGTYINLDTKSLTGCALGFDGIGKGGALWN